MIISDLQLGNIKVHCCSKLCFYLYFDANFSVANAFFKGVCKINEHINLYKKINTWVNRLNTDLYSGIGVY